MTAGQSTEPIAPSTPARAPLDQDALSLNAEDMVGDAVGEPGARPLLTLGRVDRVRVQVGYRAVPDGPAQQQFLLDLPVPGTDSDVDRDLLDESRVLTALEPVLYVGGDAPRHYSLHQHRWHTSWGPSPGVLDIGLLVTTGTQDDGAVRGPARRRGPRLPRPARGGGPAGADGRPPGTPRSCGHDRAPRRRTHVDPETMSLSAEEHHPAENSWAVGLRTTAGDEYDVVVGLVDGYRRVGPGEARGARRGVRRRRLRVSGSARAGGPATRYPPVKGEPHGTSSAAVCPAVPVPLPSREALRARDACGVAWATRSSGSWRDAGPRAPEAAPLPSHEG